MKTRFLIIEDDMMLAHFISEVLGNSGNYHVDITHTACDGLQRFNTSDYDMVLLDLSLPDEDGFTVLSHIVTNTDTAVIVISSRDDDASRIAALGQGAEDYLTKPFHPQELLLRIGKRLKNCLIDPQEIPSNRRRLPVPDTSLILDLDRQLCLAGQHRLELTPAEFNLLVTLTEAGGKIVSHDQLFDSISNLSNDVTSQNTSVGSLPVLIHRLRKKLQTYHQDEELIITLPRQGYRLNQLK